MNKYIWKCRVNGVEVVRETLENVEPDDKEYVEHKTKWFNNTTKATDSLSWEKVKI